MKKFQLLHLMMLCIISILSFTSLVNGQFDTNFILRSLHGRLSDSKTPSLIHCISSKGNPGKIVFSRELDTGQGEKLPKYSQQFLQGVPIFARILYMPIEEQSSNFGAFQCHITNGGVDTIVSTLKLPPLSRVEIDAEEPYISVNEGDDVELNMIKYANHSLDILWMHNEQEIPEWRNQLQVEIKNIKYSDRGIYECYFDGRRSLGLHGILRLIVRACSFGKFGASCNKDCPPCYNGGICHDMLGECVCPSGFIGANCETACGANFFGANCDKQCFVPAQDSGCASHIFCKPDPYGCSCAPGFKGLSCEDSCEYGTYGANCKQTCHCLNGLESCNKITGACNGGCSPGWKGDSCQIPDDSGFDSAVTSKVTCKTGTFGENCKQKCHCLGKVDCDSVVGTCPGECEDNWNGTSCNVCIRGKYGENCENTCHCQGGNENCKTDGKCKQGCDAGWTGFTCQQECAAGRFGPNCGLSCHCLDGPEACNKITGICTGDCQAGYIGKDCQTTCPVNLYGINCQKTCECLNGGKCNRINGNCTCGGYWRGQKCTDRIPQIIATSDKEINAGQYTSISCTADAIPSPSFEIISSDLNRLDTTITKFGINQYQAIANVTANSSGNYTFHCSINNTYGLDIKSFFLLVIDPPVLNERPEIINVTSTSIEISWKSWEYGIDKGGKKMDRINYLVIYRVSETTVWKTIDNWIYTTRAVIQGLLPDTEYQIAIKCRRPGKGGIGSPSPIMSARTLCGNPSPLAIPLDFNPQHFTPHTITLSWKPPIYSELHCSLMGYILCYYEGTEVHNLHCVNISKSEESYTLEGLQPFTEYVLLLFAVTPKGKGQQFAVLKFSTPEAVPGPVENLKYSQILMNPELIVIEWKTSSVKNGILKDYLIKYELMKQGLCENILSSNVHRNKTVPKSQHDVILKDLLPFSTYKVSVQASTSAGYGEERTIIVKTLESVPTSSPENVHVVSKDKNSLTFEWDPLPCDTANGFIKNYEFSLQNFSEIKKSIREKRNIDFEVWINSLTQVSDTKVTILGLLPYEEYAFAVRAVTKVGNGPFSKEIYARTTEDVPSSPSPRIDWVTEDKFIIKWNAPYPPNGVIVKYRLHIWPTDNELDTKSFSVNNNENEGGQYTFENLEPFTNYSIQVQAATKIGWGNWSSVVSVRTKEYVPDPPSKIDTIPHSNNSVTISWSPPLKPNGILSGYKVSCQPSSMELRLQKMDLIEQLVNSSTLQTTFENLHPNTEYNVTVKASTRIGFGGPIRTSFWTPTSGSMLPSIVEIVDNRTLSDSIIIKFSSGHSRIIKYQIIVEDGRNREEINQQHLLDHDSATLAKIPYYITAELDAKDLPKEDYHYFIVGDQKTYGKYKNVRLSPGVLYNIRIRTISAKKQSSISEARQHVIVSYQSDDKFEKSIFGLPFLHFIFIVLGMLVLLIIVIFIVGLKVHKYCQNKKKKQQCFTIHDPVVSDAVTWSVAYTVSDYEATDCPVVNCEKTLPLYIAKGSLLKTKKTKKQNYSEELNVDDLADYIYNKNIHPSKNFAEEFQKLPRGQCSQWLVAKKPENITKNRYGNLLPYDDNRVILKIVSDANSSDYINASYIDGYNRVREYIATQGPKENTISDFWRMVWQENSSVIVMVTSLVENGKNKCAKYWPDDSICHDDLEILLSHTESCMDFIVRTILVRKTSIGETRRVKHYQFLDWPDHKVPSSASSLLILIRRMRSENPNLESPIIVHCSAGIGRSGTFIVLDALLQQTEREKQINILSFVHKMRTQRIDMVQNLEQYIFIHETILEAVQFGNTAVMADDLPLYVKNICCIKADEKISKLESQFQVLSKIKKRIEVNDCSEALSELNIFKNRDVMIVPENQNSVKLKSFNSTEDGNNYINAITVDGYKHKDAFLVTQMPLPHTIVDFWKMIYDYNSPLIVMLNDGKRTDDPSIGQYWPTEGLARYHFYEVQVVTFEDHGTVIVRTIKLINTMNSRESPHRVVQLQFKEWPHDQILPSSASMLALLNQVDRWYRGTTGGPITIHCLNGAERCGLFCITSYICDQLKTEHALDVFNTVKKLRANRPEFITSLEQYRFCYQIALELIDSYLLHRLN